MSDTSVGAKDVAKDTFEIRFNPFFKKSEEKPPQFSVTFGGKPHETAEPLPALSLSSSRYESAKPHVHNELIWPRRQPNFLLAFDSTVKSNSLGKENIRSLLVDLDGIELSDGERDFSKGELENAKKLLGDRGFEISNDQMSSSALFLFKSRLIEALKNMPKDAEHVATIGHDGIEISSVRYVDSSHSPLVFPLTMSRDNGSSPHISNLLDKLNNQTCDGIGCHIIKVDPSMIYDPILPGKRHADMSTFCGIGVWSSMKNF